VNTRKSVRSIRDMVVDEMTVENIAPPYPGVSATSAIITAEQGFRGAYNGHPTKLEYYAKPDSTVALVHVIQIQNDNTSVWVEAYVDAHSGDIVGSTDFVAKSGVGLLKCCLTDISKWPIV
jgi:extracellular elastinolytic metalloproteinase